MATSWIRLGLILCCFSSSSCGSKEEAAPVTSQEEPKALEPAIPKAPPPKAQLAGSPTGSGFTSESIRVQVGPDEGLREQHHPKEGNQFLLVRLGIQGTANLVPKDYRIAIDKNQYTPHAIGFGRPNGVYSSVEYFVGEQVQLVKGNSDQILHDGERIQKCELKNPIVFLVYDVPETLNPSLWHGNQQFSLSPDYQALVSDLSGDGGTLTADTPINLGNPNATSSEYSAELLGSTRTRMELNATPTDVMIVRIELSTDKASTIELSKEGISLRGNLRQGRDDLFSFPRRGSHLDRRQQLHRRRNL